MELENLSNEYFDAIVKKENYVFILVSACGYETRCTYFSSKYAGLFDERYVFSINSYINNESRINNNRIFQELNFTFFEESEGGSNNILLFLNRILTYSNNVFLCIDYSSMPRIWYATIIRFLASADISGTIVSFVYSESVFEKPRNTESFNLHVEPIKGFTFLDIPDRPTALLIGLGYEKYRALGLKEYFDANKVVLFVTDRKSSMLYYDEVINNNRDIIGAADEENIFFYPNNNLSYLFFELERVIQSLIRNYRVVIAPCGPKFFTLCSLLMSIKINELDVWRISSGSTRNLEDKCPTGKIVGLKVLF